MAYTYLALAIVAEVAATSALKASEGFTRLVPSLITAVGYGISFYLLTHVLKTIPVGITYAIWSGLGIVLIALIGFAVFGQRLDMAAIPGIAMILAGVLIIHLFSAITTH